MKPCVTRACLFAALLGVIAACDSDDEPAEASDAGEKSTASKACPPNTPELNFGATGLTSEPNENLDFKAHLVEASSRPPANGFNDWTIEITDLDGNALPQASLIWACAFMPAHGHGSNPRTVTNLGEGRFELIKQNMAMEGGWLIELWVDPTGDTEAYDGGRGSDLNPSACAPHGIAESPLVFKACVPS
jgi:hypothetical protein